MIYFSNLNEQLMNNCRGLFLLILRLNNYYHGYFRCDYIESNTAENIDFEKVNY